MTWSDTDQCPSLSLKLPEETQISAVGPPPLLLHQPPLSQPLFLQARLEPTYRGSYHQLSPVSAEMLKILTPVPVPYIAVLAIISSTWGKTEKQHGKRTGNEGKYLPEKRTAITAFLDLFLAAKRLKSWFGRKKKYPENQRQWNNHKFNEKLVMSIARQPQSQTASEVSAELMLDWAIGAS